MGDCKDVSSIFDKIGGCIGFIGAGNMAWAIGEGLIKSGMLTPKQIYVSAPSMGNLRRWKDLGANISHDNGYVLENATIIFIAVKPVYLDAALDNVKNTLKVPSPNKLFISVLAGVKVAVIQDKLDSIIPMSFPSRVVRVMPNTPILVGAGASVFCVGSTATPEDCESVKQLLSVGGLCEQVPEGQMDAVCGLSGSGPAYVYTVIEALSDGAVMMGVPRQLATRYAAQTVMGAARMVLHTGKHPGQLKDEVTSPGGTTIAGLHALEKGSLRGTLMNAVEAATKRGQELGQKH